MSRRIQADQRTMRSFQAAANRIKLAAQQMKQAFPVAMRQIGEEIMTDVKDSRPGHGVPVEEGDLRATGRVDGPTDSLKGPEVRLSFGTPYALKQHETLWYHHDVGEARYLVRGIERWRPAVSRAMGRLKNRAQAIFLYSGRGASGGITTKIGGTED